MADAAEPWIRELLAAYPRMPATVIAERSLISGGRTRQQRKGEIDAAAAAVMLQGYLDHQAMQRRREGV